jgi:hypothetical protein
MDYRNLLKPIILNQPIKRTYYIKSPDGVMLDFESWSDLVDHAYQTELYDYMRRCWNDLEMSQSLKADERAFHDYFQYNLEEYCSDVGYSIVEII